MKAPLILGLGFIPGVLAGLFLASRSSDKTPPKIEVTPSQRRQSTERQSRKTDTPDPALDHPAEKFFLSGWRSTYHTLHLSDLVAEISRLTLDDFPAAISRAEGDDRIEVLLYQRWSELDPRGALSYLIDETDYNSLDCLENDLPDVALFAGNALLEKEGKPALPLILDLMKRVNEGSIGYNFGDFQGYQSLFTTWAATDFDSALHFLMIEREGFWYDGSGVGLAEGAAQAGRSKHFMEWIATHPDTFLSTDLVNRTMSEWAKRDLQTALNFAQSNQIPIDDNALEGVAQTWIEKDTDAFLAWAKSQGPTGLGLAREHALHDPQKTTAWLLENDDDSTAWNAIRTKLLSPLYQYKGPVTADLERYFQLITTGDPEVHLKHDHLGKLFLKYTQNPANYDPGDERPFRLYETGPVSELVEKYELQTEFEEFQEHQKQITIDANRLEKEMQTLSNARQKLHHESGLETNQ